MVLLTALNKVSSSLTKAIGPPLFRTGVSLRNKLVPASPNTINNYWIDMLFLIPYSQKLLSLAIYEESKVRIDAFRRHQQDNASKDLDRLGRNEDLDDRELKKLRDAGNSAFLDASSASQLANIRLNVLNDILRPSVFPSERWGHDIEDSWRYNVRLVAWLRKEILLAKYGPYIQEAMVAYPSLRGCPQLQTSKQRRIFMDLMHRGIINLNDTDTMGTTENVQQKNGSNSVLQRLPRSNVVVKALGMRDWAETKNTAAFRKAVSPTVTQLGGTIYNPHSAKEDVIPKTTSSSTLNDSSEHEGTRASHRKTLAFNHAIIPHNTSLDETAIEDVLDAVTGGYINSCGPLNALCQEANCYQLWTREYVEHLGEYLMRQIQDSNCTTSVVLDVGAGDGLLIQCLKEYIHGLNGSSDISNKRRRKKSDAGTIRSVDDLKLVATDDMSWNIFTKANVEKLPVEEALKKYVQKKVLPEGSQPMQPSEDKQSCYVIVLCSWMPMCEDWTAAFRQAGVDEYILIGESDDGSCGHNWLTWGNDAFRDATLDLSQCQASVPPHEMDGYNRRDLHELTPFQFSSFDCSISKSSNTVSFRKSGRI